jgi:hypothetical protein
MSNPSHLQRGKTMIMCAENDRDILSKISFNGEEEQKSIPILPSFLQRTQKLCCYLDHS